MLDELDTSKSDRLTSQYECVLFESLLSALISN
jgi:hypothetical protein